MMNSGGKIEKNNSIEIVMGIKPVTSADPSLVVAIERRHHESTHLSHDGWISGIVTIGR